MKFNFENRTIDMTKSEAKLASNLNSHQFKELMSMRKEFPDFTIYVIPTKSIKKNEKKESYRGLTYAYMEAYIASHGDANIMEEYYHQRNIAECHSVRYPNVKKWFLAKFPEIARFGISFDLTPAV